MDPWIHPSIHPFSLFQIHLFILPFIHLIFFSIFTYSEILTFLFIYLCTFTSLSNHGAYMLSVYYMRGILGLWEKKKDSGTPLAFRESRREDGAARNHKTKKKWIDAKRDWLRNVKKINRREIWGALGWGAAGSIGKNTGLRFSFTDLALNLALPLSVPLP